MLDRFLAKTLGQQLGRHVHMCIICADGANKTLVSLVKLCPLALGNREVIPDARIIWGEFRSPLQLFEGRFEIAGLKEKISVVVQVLRIVFISTHRSLESLQRTIVYALADVADTEKVLDLGRFRID